MRFQFPDGATQAEMVAVIVAALREKERIRENRQMHKRERKAYERENRQRAVALNERIRESVKP